LIDPDGDPSAAVSTALASVTDLARIDGVHTTALAVDPKNWEIVHFTLWSRQPPLEQGERYRVLHLSTPHLSEIVTPSSTPTPALPSSP
jgi:Domain of unknown function (DUF4865)